MKTSSFLAVLFLLPAVALAVPSKPVVVGTVSTGVTLTITGTSFGTKSAAAPLTWDNLDASVWTGYSSLVDGDEVPVIVDAGCDCPWKMHAASIIYWETSPSEVRVTGRPVYKIAQSGSFGEQQYSLDASDPVLTIDWWGKMNKDYRDNENGVGTACKLARAWSSSNEFGGKSSIYSWEMNGYVDDGAGGIVGKSFGMSSANVLFTPNDWHHFRLEVFSDGISQAGGGNIRWILNNGYIRDMNDELASISGHYDRIERIGFSPRSTGLPLGYEPGMFAWFGDFYIDDTLSRVALGDADNWGSVVHYEMQIPTAWAADGESISVTCNTGSFADESNVWLYVFDSNGAVSPASNVLEVDSEYTGDLDPPANPTGLSGVAGNTTASLSWVANTESDISGYIVARSLTSGSGYTNVTSEQAATSFINSGLTNGLTYYYVVRAVDDSGNISGYSNEVSVMPLGAGVPDTITRPDSLRVE